MFRVFGFLTKRQDLERQAFIDYYEQRHVPLICSLGPTPLIYKRRYLLRGDELNIGEDALGFDVMTELVFEDRAAFLAWRMNRPSGSREIVVLDEAQFLDRSRTKACVLEEYVTSG